MAKIISLPFEYKGKEYYTLIRARCTPESTMFKITIMNGELEQTLHGDNIVEYRDGVFMLPQTDEIAPANLKQKIVDALQEYITAHPIEDNELS